MHKVVVVLSQTVSEGRPFSLGSETFISMAIQLFNAIVLAVALSLILYKPVKKYLRQRTESIQSKIDNAEAAMSRANSLISEYETKIKEIDSEGWEILEAARNKAVGERKTILEEARSEAREIKDRALEVVESDKRRLAEETRIYIIETASAIANKYVAQNIDDAAHDKLFEETLAQLEEAQWQM